MPYEFTNQYEKQEQGFYIDEPFCSTELFKKVQFDGAIHDPACGLGTILMEALKAGYPTTGQDIINHKFLQNFSTQDYLTDQRRHENIVTNPPYNNKLDEKFALHAIRYTRKKIALLVRLAFLEGQGRKKRLFIPYRPSLILVFSKRPSMPPPGVPVGGGKTAYCWIIWDNTIETTQTLTDWI